MALTKVSRGLLSTSIVDNGNATAITIDSSENVGIGTGSPSTKLHLGGTAPLDSIIRQDSTVSGTNWEIGERAAGKWQIWEDDSDSVVATFMSSGNVGIGTSSPATGLDCATTNYTFAGTTYDIYGLFGDTSGGIRLGADSSNDDSVIGTTGTNDLQFVTYNGSSWGSRMTLSNTGNLLVGQTVGEVIGVGNTTEGISLGANGRIFASYNGQSAYLNRNGTDGALLGFYRGGTAVGSIGVTGTNDIAIYSTTANHTGLRLGEGYYIPTNNTGGTADNAVDLGLASIRYKDLYLGGGVYLGGTGAANRLDDYEEGTFSPSVTTASGTISISAQQGKYVKVGDVVHYWIRVVATCTSTTVIYNVDGLPFSTAAYSGFYAGPTIANAYHVALGTNATVLGGYYLNNTNSIRLHSYGNQTAQLSPSVSANGVFELRFEGSYRLTA